MFFLNNKHKTTPERVVISSQAYLTVVSEVSAFSGIETGGIFLGTIENNIWYIIEAIDPGYEDITRESSYFKYDVKYVNHLANIRNKLYNRDLVLLGLWHRHPGSMDYFSGTDKETNKKFAGNSAGGSLSALVNIDPAFRITMYHIAPDFSYTKISVNNTLTGNNHIPADFLKMKDTAVYLDIINRESYGNSGKTEQKLMQVFESEYAGYLSSQRDFEYEVRMNNGSIGIEMKRINNDTILPELISVVLSHSGINQIVVQFDNNPRKYLYEDNIIQKYLEHKQQFLNKPTDGGQS
jgi:proteasome lid subunit RPN8/RPN11